MADFRRFPQSETRQIIDYNRFMDLTGEKVFICLDRGVMEIARYLLNTRGSWRTSYVKEYVGTVGYNMPTEEEFENVLHAIAEGNVDMSNCEDIASELAGIKDAILNKPCCGGSSGSRGSGTSQQAPNPYNQDETPAEPPPGFDDMEQFESHKCKQAQDIIDNLKSDLVGLAGVTYAGSSPTGLVGAVIVFLLTPIPFDDLIALLGYLIFTGYNYTFLATMAGEINDNNNDLLCALYNAGSAEDAKSDFMAVIEEIAAAAFPIPADADWTVGAVEYMTTYDSFNRLFTNQPTTNQSADCSGCGSGCEDAEWIVSQGSITTGEPTDAQVTITSVAGPDVAGSPRYWIVFGYSCLECYRANISSVGYTRGDLESHLIGNAWYECPSESATVSYSNVPSDISGLCFTGIDGDSFVFNSRSPFTLTIEFVELCTPEE